MQPTRGTLEAGVIARAVRLVWVIVFSFLAATILVTVAEKAGFDVVARAE
jgi:hypothetical protein